MPGHRPVVLFTLIRGRGCAKELLHIIRSNIVL